MPDLIGKTLGAYRVVSQIGLGGMATVYKAYQPSMDRYVALKVLSTHLTQDPAFIKRFEQEAKIIAKLEHLNILPVYDHGEQDGYLYLVMRYIEAGTLTDRLKQGQLALEQVRRVVTQVGSALEYAHQLGVVHRDVKPSNVLVDPQGDCYLTDFGIARMVEGTLGLTGSGVIGTPHYMAPEQSKSRQADHRADIYAMGVVIYEMITGRVPYDAETPFAVVMMHLTEPLPLPRSIRPDLPEAVERVILKALAKDPSERYQSMRDLVVAFDEAMRQAPAFEAPSAVEKPVPPTTLMRGAAPAPAWKRWLTDQLPWLLPAAGLALIVLIVAGVILSRIPGRVEISGGQVQLVTPAVTTETGQAVVPAPTPTTETARAVAPLPTVTSAPQPTAMPTAPSSPAVEQARTFAEPILKAIANRPPDFADDFSTTDKKWETGFGEQGTHKGKVETTDGVARMTLSENSDGFINSGLEFKNFALTLDGRQSSGNPESVRQVFLGLPEHGWIMLDMTSTGSWNLSKLQSAKEAPTPKASGKFTPSKDGADHIAIVVQGSRFALLLNNEPMTYIEDKDLDMARQVWFMCLGQPDMVCEFDNIRFWNLDNVPGLP